MEYRPPSLAHSCGNIKAEGADDRCRVIAERARVHMADSTYISYFRRNKCMFGSKDKNLTPLGGNDITKLFIFFASILRLSHPVEKAHYTYV